MTHTASTPQRSASAALAFERVAQRFANDAPPVLSSISFELARGEIVALMGASGSGKSTALRIAAGLDAPTSGTVFVHGIPSAGINPLVAVGFQEPRLLPWRSVRDNVRYGVRGDRSKTESDALVDELVHEVQLDDYANYRPRQISGGMAQRVSLARALARRPEVLLLDEPFGALDALTRLQMHDVLLKLHAKHEPTVLLVTHDPDEALYLADRILVLGRGDSGARIVAELGGFSPRPRRRDDVALVPARERLLETLGVHAHHAS